MKLDQLKQTYDDQDGNEVEVEDLTIAELGQILSAAAVSGQADDSATSIFADDGEKKCKGIKIATVAGCDVYFRFKKRLKPVFCFDCS